MTNQLECEIGRGRVASHVRISSAFLDLRDLVDPGVFSRPSLSVHRLGLHQSSTALADDVNASQVEMLRGLQHVAVVRVDLLEAMLLGAGQVERVTRSDEDRGRKVENGFAGLFQKLGRHTQPLPHTVLLIFFEVFQDGRHLPASYVVLSDVPLEY